VLNLRNNRIGTSGAEHLANALKSNTVKLIFFFEICSKDIFLSTDTIPT
jgi:hypothetical protein